ncbi:MAG TPA: isocitrate lyase [Bacteroidota bacterium]|jgi:isocitrate lyase|nr:isocitrate lyase [Bacteroidota bacterium]
MNNNGQVSELVSSWANDPRWRGVERPFIADDVVRLGGSLRIEFTLAREGANRFWKLLHEEPYVRALGASTGNQAIQQVRAGLQAIYVSGWQVAADANTAGQMYPDQSLYPADSVPNVVRRINHALRRADLIERTECRGTAYWYAPIVADAEAGFGGSLNAFELTQALIEAGAAAIHLEDQLSSMKKCGHMGGKVLAAPQEFISKIVAARFASDILDVPMVIIARTDANGAKLIQSDIDPIDEPFLTGERTAEGFFCVRGGLEFAITRALRYAPFSDLIWCETSSPDLGEAREFAQALHAKFPEKMLAYNCSPSFNWRKRLDLPKIRRFQDDLGDLGYKFQFVTLAGFHTLNASMFQLARAYREEGMAAYSRLQEDEFEMERLFGYDAIKHQHFVGAGYFDEVQLAISNGMASTVALKDSTEADQFR